MDEPKKPSDQFSSNDDTSSEPFKVQVTNTSSKGDEGTNSVEVSSNDDTNEPADTTDTPAVDDSLKQTYDNEPETYVDADGQPTTLPEKKVDNTVAAPTAAPAVAGQKSGAKKWLVWGVALLLLAGLGAFAYWQYTDAASVRDELGSVKAERDALKAAAAKDDNTSDDLNDDETATTPTDKELIVKEVTASTHAVTASEKALISTNIKKQNDRFAYVTVTEGQGGGYAVILKKADDQWVIIHQGQDKPDQTTITRYSIPTEYQTGQ